MLKKMITYEDFNGLTRTEPFYFNLSESELTEMEVEVDGGMSNMLQQIVDANDGKQIMKNFKIFIKKSYGVKSDDGRRFEKSEKLSEEFLQTAAYDALFHELITNTNAGADFINGILPKGYAKGSAPVAK